jgi:hypothetical protein
LITGGHRYELGTGILPLKVLSAYAKPANVYADVSERENPFPDKAA